MDYYDIIFDYLAYKLYGKDHVKFYLRDLKE